MGRSGCGLLGHMTYWHCDWWYVKKWSLSLAMSYGKAAPLITIGKTRFLVIMGGVLPQRLEVAFQFLDVDI